MDWAVVGPWAVDWAAGRQAVGRGLGRGPRSGSWAAGRRPWTAGLLLAKP